MPLISCPTCSHIRFSIWGDSTCPWCELEKTRDALLALREDLALERARGMESRELSLELEAERNALRKEISRLKKAWKWVLKFYESGKEYPKWPVDAPCIVCGYNGPGFYQPGSHKDGCPLDRKVLGEKEA